MPGPPESPAPAASPSNALARARRNSSSDAVSAPAPPVFKDQGAQHLQLVLSGILWKLSQRGVCYKERNFSLFMSSDPAGHELRYHSKQDQQAKLLPWKQVLSISVIEDYLEICIETRSVGTFRLRAATMDDLQKWVRCLPKPPETTQELFERSGRSWSMVGPPGRSKAVSTDEVLVSPGKLAV